MTNPTSQGSVEEVRSLADRCEAATGPDRELDAAIMAVLFVRDSRYIGARVGGDDEPWEDCLPVKDDVWVDPVTDKWVSTSAYQLTASLDAAMTLVPEGADVGVHREQGRGVAYLLPDGADTTAATPALALCAAALRSRASSALSREVGKGDNHG